MGPLRYHIWREGAGFAWDVLAEDLTVVAKGHAVDLVSARVAAMLAILRNADPAD